MDPKALSHLDPKQTEAYHRVMGTAAEIHGDQSIAPTDQSTSAIDQAAEGTTSQPFDINTGGLSSSPAIDTESLYNTAVPGTQSSADTNPHDPTPSIFTNNAAAPDPTQTEASANPTAVLSPSPATAASESEMPTPEPANVSPVAPAMPEHPSSFFSSNPIPEPTTDEGATPELASAVGFPPVGSPEAVPQTVASDNLAPVTPYVPDASEAPSGVNVTMQQPFNTQPLPSPAEVNAAATHEASPLLRVLYIVGAVVFFAIYTIFWVKIFNLPFIF